MPELSVSCLKPSHRGDREEIKPLECFLDELGLGAAPLPLSGISPGLFPASDPLLCCCPHSVPVLVSAVQHPALLSHPRCVTELEPPAECLITPDLIAMGDQRGREKGGENK